LNPAQSRQAEQQGGEYLHLRALDLDLDAQLDVLPKPGRGEVRRPRVGGSPSTRTPFACERRMDTPVASTVATISGPLTPALTEFRHRQVL
jgi:hypothetical protein